MQSILLDDNSHGDLKPLGLLLIIGSTGNSIAISILISCLLDCYRNDLVMLKEYPLLLTTMGFILLASICLLILNYSKRLHQMYVVVFGCLIAIQWGNIKYLIESFF